MTKLTSEQRGDLRLEYYKETGNYVLMDIFEYIMWLENKLVKNLSLSDVVGQSEQLVCSCGRLHESKEFKSNLCDLCTKPIKAN